MTTNVAYHNNYNMLVRFIDHAKIGLYDDIGAERPSANLIENAGELLIYTSKIPYRTLKAVAKKVEDPRYVTVGLTALALAANSYGFYPERTQQVAEHAIEVVADLIKDINIQEKAWLGSYLFTCTGILGYGTRAEGRFLNTDLMKAFYGVNKDVKSNPAGMSNAEITVLKA